jgi:hypothetical protein
MRNRCLDPTSPAWDRYGGRGITIFEGWIHDPAAFIAHVGPRPSPRHEIDRENNDRGYEPGNVRWVVRKINDRNRRSNRHLEYQGESRTVIEWCEIFNISRTVVDKRLLAGWSVDRALTTPVKPRKPDGTGWRALKRARERAKESLDARSRSSTSR